MIDWTQPVETTEYPPRPVRVLATDMRYAYPIVCAITEAHGYECIYLYGTDGKARNVPALRNVAPPEPEPVLREAQNDRDAWCAKAEALQAEVDRMKPVVGAAVAGVDSFNRRGLLRLIEAVRAYQNQQPAEPVKICTTCPTCNGLGFGLPSGPKQDTTCPTCSGTGKKEMK